jgi:hypothetical protein
MRGWNLSQSHPFSLDKLQQVYVNSSKEKKKGQKKKGEVADTSGL